MPAGESSSSAVLDALGYALFVRDDAGILRLAEDAPEWLARLWPAAGQPGAELPVADASPFLENFLIDAQECWGGDADGRRESGPWVEPNARGEEVQLQALALHAKGRACLLIERLGEAFAARVAVLQKARETVITLQKLDAEIQKKEILVHCLAEDLSRSLGNSVTALRLLELENLPAKALPLLNLALRSAQEQRSLIEKVLGFFPDELSGLYGRGEGGPAGADLRRALRQSVENLHPHFSEKGVRLSQAEAVEEELRILADEAHAGRVVENLLRVALDGSPSGSEVVVRVALEEDAALFTLEFSQDAARIESEGTLGPQSGAGSPEAFLRLRFCRIAVEGCRGEMGFRPREGGGTCAWVRLPRWSAAT